MSETRGTGPGSRRLDPLDSLPGKSRFGETITLCLLLLLSYLSQ